MSSMLRLLAVEDFAPLAKGLARALRQAGFDVVVTSSRAEALAMQGWFDAAIVDLELPDGTGIEVARDLRAGGHVENVVFFTACRDPGLLSVAAETGKLVDKSAGVTMLIAMLNKWLSAGEQRQVAVGDPAEPSPAAGRGSSLRSGTRRIQR
jgi:DNA-binding response OmpR family regulator